MNDSVWIAIGIAFAFAMLFLFLGGLAYTAAKYPMASRITTEECLSLRNNQ